MTFKVNLDSIILILLFLIIPLDLLNGVLLHNNINLPLSISQAFKLIVIILFFIRILKSPNKVLFILLLGSAMLLPSFYQIIKQGTLGFIFYDFVKISRYLLPIFSFFFFSKLFSNKNELNIKIAFNVIKFSYTVMALSILLKYIGLGYPMYKAGDIGSRGFFHAGNELSFLLIILGAILAFELWRKKKVKTYVAFFCLNLVIGILLSSKTAILGVFLFTFLLPLKPLKIKIELKKLNYLIISFFVLLPSAILFSWKWIKNSSLFDRLSFFWQKLDIVTFIFSSRNIFVEKSWKIYKEEYNLIEKTIGLGQENFEDLNNGKIIEIDVLDIFFTYGFLGIVCFFSIIFSFFVYSRKKQIEVYPYSRFVYLMLGVILAISTLAGHVFNSGIAGIYLGFMLSLVYAKNN